METAELQEAQHRLEEKRASLQPTGQELTSSPELPQLVTCDDCGNVKESVVIPYSSTPIFFCKHCNDEREKKEEESRKAAAARAAEMAITKRLEQCNIGQRFRGMTFADYKPSCEKSRRVLAQCQEYVAAFKPESGCNVMMIGSPGTGKNMLSAIIGQEVIKMGYSSLHTTAMKLVRKIKDTWRNKEQSEQDAIDMFVAPALLVIDEIGVQFGSQTEQLFLTEVINERYERRKPTILISNLRMSQIIEIMGERVIDRFYDDGSKMMVFDWQSYRRRSKE
jgi:DNA replication protein DnaC